MRIIRYYSPAYKKEEHEKILELLDEIRETHGIEYEVIPVRKTDWYDEEPVMTEEEIYEKHLKPQTRILKQNTGETAARLFKSRSGNIFVAGTVAVVENGEVIWANPFENPFKENESFLLRVLNRGWSEIEKFKSGVAKKDVHNKLFSLLKEKNLPEPEVKDKVWLREVVAGFTRTGIQKQHIEEIIEKLDPRVREIYYNKMRRVIDQLLYRKFLQEELSYIYGSFKPSLIKFVDFLVLFDDHCWVLEGKEKLNFEAIGQVLVYRELIKEDYPHLGEVRMGVICFEGDSILEKTCKNLEIEVFIF